VLTINLKQNKEIIHVNKVKERKPMHDDNNVWMKRIKKLRNEREYTCKAQRKMKMNLQPVDFEAQRR
jgi:hypothetical protein